MKLTMCVLIVPGEFYTNYQTFSCISLVCYDLALSHHSVAMTHIVLYTRVDCLHPVLQVQDEMSNRLSRHEYTLQRMHLPPTLCMLHESKSSPAVSIEMRRQLLPCSIILVSRHCIDALLVNDLRTRHPVSHIFCNDYEQVLVWDKLH